MYFAVLITGGYGSDGVLDTAELFVPSTGLSCSLPRLPEVRWRHTVERTGLLCGGEGEGNTPINTCLLWSPDTGSWDEYLTLDVWRSAHVSWTPVRAGPDAGTYLMGGGDDYNNWKTTTWIKPNGTQTKGFSLSYYRK